MKRIYFDYASTTPIDKRILKKLPEFSENFGNPSSISKEGVMAKKQLEDSRKSVADCLFCHSDEIVFTSGGTESNNLAIFGVINSLKKNGIAYEKMHIISSNIEHSSVNEVFGSLEKLGVKVDYLKVDNEGLVNPKDLRKLLNKETVLVSVMFANNEIGTIEPIKEIAKEIRHFKKFNKVEGKKETPFPYFHSDASQAFCYQEIKLENLGVDLMTLDSQKIYGPKGVGALYVKRGCEIESIILGGGQENGLRSGTENVPMISAFTLALNIARQEREKENKRLLVLRDYLIEEIPKIFKGAVLNGSKNFRLSNNVNFSLPDCDTEMLALRLDAKGISVSTKSACMDEGDGSYVIKALGGLDWRMNNTIRVSLGRYTTKNDCDKFISTLRDLKKRFF